MAGRHDGVEAVEHVDHLHSVDRETVYEELTVCPDHPSRELDAWGGRAHLTRQSVQSEDDPPAPRPRCRSTDHVIRVRASMICSRHLLGGKTAFTRDPGQQFRSAWREPVWVEPVLGFFRSKG